MNDALYRCVKNLQVTAQAAVFAIPLPESKAHEALRLGSEEWKLQQAIDVLLWLEKKAASAATAIFMEGKD